MNSHSCCSAQPLYEQRGPNAAGGIHGSIRDGNSDEVNQLLIDVDGIRKSTPVPSRPSHQER